jgi:hypothetical protein
MRLAGFAFALSVLCSACALQMADDGDVASSGAGLTTPATSPPTNPATSSGSGFGSNTAKAGGGTSTSSATQMASGSQTANPASVSTCLSPGTPQCEPEPQPWAPSKSK